MKKFLSVLLAACLCCGMLAGCGKEKSITNDFDSSTNQNENIAGYSFEVPEAWEKGEKFTENTLYFYPSQGMLTVMYSESEVSILNVSDRESFIEGMASGFEEFKLVNESETVVNDEKAYKFEMKVKMAGDDYSVSMVTFDCGFGLVSFMLGTLQTSDEDYSADFDKVLQSIEKPLPFTKTIDDVCFMYSMLQSSDEYSFVSEGVQEASDGSTMEILYESENGAMITILGDEDENLTLVSVSAEGEEYFSSMCVMALIGSGVYNNNSSKEIPLNLSADSLKELGTEPTDAIIEVANGISYFLQKNDDGSYRMIIQRDAETKEDYLH